MWSSERLNRELKNKDIEIAALKGANERLFSAMHKFYVTKYRIVPSSDVKGLGFTLERSYLWSSGRHYDTVYENWQPMHTAKTKQAVKDYLKHIKMKPEMVDGSV